MGAQQQQRCPNTQQGHSTKFKNLLNEECSSWVIQYIARVTKDNKGAQNIYNKHWFDGDIFCWFSFYIDSFPQTHGHTDRQTHWKTIWLLEISRALLGI